MGDGKTDPTVVISTEWPSNSDIPPSFIWFRPTDLNWNDFGHVANAEIGLVEGGILIFKYLAKAAYFDTAEQEYIGIGNAWLKSRSDRRMITTDSRSVISLARSQEAYREIIGELGIERGNFYLKAASDLVYISGESSKKDLERAALNSDVFKFSLSRESDAYYAFKNSRPVLRGLNHEDISSGPEKVIIALQDRGGDVEIDFTFDHSTTIPKRTCVIIGKNGVGKSRALGNIARKALSGIRRGASDESDRIVASRVLAFTSGNEVAGTFPDERWKRPATFYKRLSTSRARRKGSGGTATASIVELSRNERKIAEKSRFSIFMDALYAINRPEEIAFRASVGDSTIRLTKLRTNSEQLLLNLLSGIDISSEPGRLVRGHFYHLSTGEVSFIKLLAQICTYIENGSLLLLDEPEAHLHPNFIARLMNALEKLLDDTGSCAIMATHSVYVVREVFHDQVVVVEKDNNGNVAAKSPGMRTFGADISSISTFIFGEEDVSFLADDVIKRIRNENLSIDEIRKKYGAYLSREIMSELRSDR